MSSNSAPAVSPATKDLAFRIGMAILVAAFVFGVVKRLFASVASLWGGGLTDAQKRAIAKRFDPGPLNTALYDRTDPSGMFTDATHDQRAALQAEVPYLEGIAQAIADAPGFFQDNEAGLFDALSRIRSQYELLWVNRLFNGTNWRTLGVFSPDMSAPSIGAYMDAFLQDADWLKAMEHLNNLPKYP